MPELPEVETIVIELNKKVLGRTFLDIWTDASGLVKYPKDFKQFRRDIKGKKIKSVWRRGKNIIFDLSDNYCLLIHQKLTGHLLFGKWETVNGKWVSLIPVPLLDDPINSFLHLIFFFDNETQMALSDVRKFAKVELWGKNNFEKKAVLGKLGPEPLEKTFSFKNFKEALLKKKNGKIKQVLMNQDIIAGIGNIYSDEILWAANVNPFKEIKALDDKSLEKIYKKMKEILQRAIDLGGESISDFRRLSGEKGNFGRQRKVYGKKGEACSRCGDIIKREIIGGRSAHYCPRCQKE